MSKHVVVIGAGIIGVCAAKALLDDGCRVTLVDPLPPGGRQAASFGNGTWISPASIIPLSTPGLWRKLPALLFDREGPLVIRWRAIPLHISWLVRFLIAGSTMKRVAATADALAALLGDAPSLHREFAQRVGAGDLMRSEGLLYVYPDREVFEAESVFWRLRRERGVAYAELDEKALREREPAISDRYTFGVLVEEGAHCIDPGALVAAAASSVVEAGGDIVAAEARELKFKSGKLKAVRTTKGNISCDLAVIAAGVGSKRLAAQVWDTVPLIAERGYHAVIKDPKVRPARPLMPSDGKMANVMTPAGLRTAGQVEIAGPRTPPDWRRAEVLLHHALRTFPGLGPRSDMQVERWMGNRPSTSDGLPAIGFSRVSPDVVHAFGHGHVGLAAGPKTGAIVADLVAGRPPRIPIEAFSPQRFPYHHFNPLN